jgi:hypothetical protein
MLAPMGKRLLAALEEMRADLDRDVWFGKGRYTTAALALLLGKGSDTNLGALFGDTLQGMIQSARYGGIKAVRHMLRDVATKESRPSLAIAKGESVVVEGDLRVDGNVDNAGILVVTGDLEIGGNYLGPTFSYSLVVVGGWIRVQHLSASGEVIAGGGLEATGVVHFIYNDYSSVLPVVRAKALVTEDNFPVLGAVTATRVDGHASDAQLEAWFGAVPAIDEDEGGSAVRAGIERSAAAKRAAKSKSKPKSKRPPRS